MEFGFHAARTHWFKKVMIGAAAGALTFGLMAGASPAKAQADEVSDVQAQAQTALDSLNDLLAQEDQATQDYFTAAQNMEQAQADIDTQNQNISNYQSQLSNRARMMYRGGQDTYLSVLLGSNSFTDFANNWDLLNKMNQKDADLVSQTKQARQQLEEDEQNYSDQKDQALQKRDEIAAESEQMRDTYNNLSQQAKDMLASQQSAKATLTAVGGDAASSVNGGSGGTSADTSASDDGTGTAGGGQTEVVSASEVQSYDASSGTVTLSDGTQAQATYDPSTGNYIVQRAMQFVGGNYGWGQQNASTNTFDCSGLVDYVYGWGSNGQHGGDAESIYENTTQIDSSQAQPGDILIWGAGTGNAWHTAIYAGNGMMVSADNPSSGINYEQIYGNPIYTRAN